MSKEKFVKLAPPKWARSVILDKEGKFVAYSSNTQTFRNIDYYYGGHREIDVDIVPFFKESALGKDPSIFAVSILLKSDGTFIGVKGGNQDYPTGVSCKPGDEPPDWICAMLYKPECREGEWWCIFEGGNGK